MKKRLAALGMALSLTAGVLSGCSSKLDNSEVIVTMGDMEITADIANFYARYQQSMYETYYGMTEDTWEMELEEGKDYETSVKGDILTSLETLFVLDAHKDEYNVEVTEEENTKIKEAAEAFVAANGDEELKAVSGNASTIERVLELMTIQNKMYEAMVADVDTEVSDEEAAQKKMQYVSFDFTTTDEEGNSVELTEDELAALKKEAEDFNELVQLEEDFSTYAVEQGYSPQDATFDAESTSPAAELSAAADALGEGEYTGVVQTDKAYYVAKVVSLLDREATDAKKETIVQERKDTQYQELCDQWIKDTDPEINESAWKKVDFKKQGTTIKNTNTEEDAAEDTAAEDDGAAVDDSVDETKNEEQ